MHKLNCNINRDNIITDRLSVFIDISNIKSWDTNPDFRVKSLTKWKDSISNNVSLRDYGLTMFDYGLTNNMGSGKVIDNDDSYLVMNRIGYNSVTNNISLSGDSIGAYDSEVIFDGYGLSGMTSDVIGNFFHLDGGYLTGNFMYSEYEHEILPTRYNHGITIENLLYLNQQSSGIFYYMGVRSDDKYNPYFEGETTFDGEVFDGVYTSTNEYLHSKQSNIKNNASFRGYNNMKSVELSDIDNNDNIRGNVIAFGIKNDDNLFNKKIFCKFVDENNNTRYLESDHTFNLSGSTLITITYKPDTVIEDPELLYCVKRRKGKLFVYLNGRIFWIVPDMDEFYFNEIYNDKTKQIGIPYTINWGGGSFGLKHSYHYNSNNYVLFDGQPINNDFIVV
jgi:hypothetical protein